MKLVRYLKQPDEPHNTINEIRRRFCPFFREESSADFTFNIIFKQLFLPITCYRAEIIERSLAIV